MAPKVASSVRLLQAIRELADIGVQIEGESAPQEHTEVPVEPTLPTTGPEHRIYAVFKVPNPSVNLGPGLYWGTFPTVWDTILAQGKAPRINSLAGSGIHLKRYETLSAAREAYKAKQTGRAVREIPIFECQ